VCTGCDCLDPEKARLIVIRGNSASGKSTIAAAIREKYGRGLAVISQDNIRRVVLREHDRPGAVNIGLISLTCRYALGAGFCTVLEGILCSAHYGEMLAELRGEYGDRSSWWYLDVPFEETLTRHGTKPQAAEYGRAEMEQWWRERDLLPGGLEQIITAGMTAEAAADQIMRHAGLASAAGWLQP
jgi:predicted kinase